MKNISFRQFSTSFSSGVKQPIFEPRITGILGRNWKPLPVPHKTIPEPKGQDLDFVNVAHSHLIHSDWAKLDLLSSGLTPFRVKHILLKIQKDHVLSHEFFKWVGVKKASLHTLETHSMILHILTRNGKFKSAESILRGIIVSGSIDLPPKLFDEILYSYRICDSSPVVFDLLFKTFAHVRKFRNASDTFCRMKDYGFLPRVESCNAYISSLLDLDRVDVTFTFYKEMQRYRISPNVYTLNMVIRAYCKSGKLDKALQVFKEMESMGCSPTVASYNTLIAGYCNKGLLSFAMKLKSLMGKNGILPDVVTFNTLINGFCKEGKVSEANKLFSEMKSINVAPNTVTYNTLINGYSQGGNADIGAKLYEEMTKNQVKADILTYNALILGLCKEGKTKKAANLVKELDKENLVPNVSTFSALIGGQCVRKNSDRAFQLYKSMVRAGYHPNEHTFGMLISTFCKNKDFDGAVQVLREMFDRLIVPDLGMLTVLCEGLHKSGKQKLVMSLCSEMEVRRLMPEGFDIAKVICPGTMNENKAFNVDL
ncbi:pentatricopeptide repeat-containing protein At4g26680, mitochondrial [Ziziphus jujuba]|uniref:Pentatricopeptide repeat-containing protein At4g26680, mitochondrial n=2 Tax=Ziziphus jujuba TaxID=326968 RepID=A0A6P6FLM8_ZIZJJ|nr:pentatricopeptide repeat-containing protein At4g26680, mitochondrial [Ziziphus jujuba]KAH7533492.1 hypothetical protein FEM48_Zijuj04G0136600 [Ziziphus jujuba var. spinosa]